MFTHDVFNYFITFSYVSMLEHLSVASFWRGCLLSRYYSYLGPMTQRTGLNFVTPHQ